VDRLSTSSCEKATRLLTILKGILSELDLVSKVGPAGVGPATKRIQAQFQFGYSFKLYNGELLT
jgi:hypothetical protein